MTYQLRNLDEIQKKLGKKTLEKLFCHVEKGILVKSDLESMSYSHNMNVSETYTKCEEAKYIPSKILEKMLDDWYKKALFKMSPADAKRRLQGILQENCAPIIAGELLEELNS